MWHNDSIYSDRLKNLLRVVYLRLVRILNRDIYHPRNFKITAAVLISDAAYPILKRCKESLKRFDEVILFDELVTDFSEARNRLVQRANNPFVFFLDSDEIINPNVYEDLANIFKKKPDVAVQFPRANIRDRDMYFSASWRFPDLQCRAGHRKVLTYKSEVHETIARRKTVTWSFNMTSSRFLIVHYGNCIEEWNLEKLENTQKKFQKLGSYSLFEKYDADTFQELLYKMRNDEVEKLDNLALKGYILPFRMLPD